MMHWMSRVVRYVWKISVSELRLSDVRVPVYCSGVSLLSSRTMSVTNTECCFHGSKNRTTTLFPVFALIPITVTVF